MTNITQLHNRLNTVCVDRYGLSYDDLPDLVFLSEYCWDGMTKVDINDSASDILDELIDQGELPTFTLID